MQIYQIIMIVLVIIVMIVIILAFKNEAEELKSKEERISNLQQSIVYYDEMLENRNKLVRLMEKREKELIKRNLDLEAKNVKLYIELKDLKGEVIESV